MTFDFDAMHSNGVAVAEVSSTWSLDPKNERKNIVIHHKHFVMERGIDTSRRNIYSCMEFLCVFCPNANI